MLDFFRQAIALRHAHPALRGGQCHQVYAHDRQYSFVRRDETETLLIVLNASDAPCEISVPVSSQLGDGTILRPLFGILTARTVRDGMVAITVPARSGGVLGK